MELLITTLVMMLNFNRSKKTKWQVGISVDETTLSWIMVRKKGQEITVENSEQYAVTDVAAALLRIKKQAANLPCYMALPHREVILKTLAFSNHFKKQEILKLLCLNSEQYFSYPLTAIYFDYEFLQDQSNQIRVVAGKKAVIEKWRNQFARAELNLKMISVNVLALERYLISNHLMQVKEVYLVCLDQTSHLIQVVFVNNLVTTMSTLKITNNRVECYLQEMQQLIRLYQTNKSYDRPINKILFISKNEQLSCQIAQQTKLPIETPDCLNSSQFGNNNIICQGMVAEC